MKEKHVLLIEGAGGEVLAVVFPSLAQARDWEDAHAVEILGRGAIPVVTQAEALRRAAA